MGTTGNSSTSGKTTSTSSTGATTATQTVIGKLKFELASMADCNKLAASTKFNAAVCTEVKKTLGLDAKTPCTTKTSCTSKRRLAADGRFLATGANAASEFTMTNVPKDKAAAAVTKSTTIKANSVKNIVTTAQATDSTLSGITPSGFKDMEKLTATDTINTSMAVAIGFLSAIVFACAGHLL